MRLDEEIRASHRDLSEVSEEFLSHIEELCRSGPVPSPKPTPVPGWTPRYTVQPWPVFMGERKREEFRRASAEVTRLVKSIPDRVFQRDPVEMSRCFGMGSPHLLALFLEPPDGVPEAVVRCDLIDDGEDLKCVEVNISTRLGGWDLRYWQLAYREHPPVTSFTQPRGMEPFYQDPFDGLFRHMARQAWEAGLCEDMEANVVIRLGPGWKTNPEGVRPFNEMYAEILREIDPRLKGEISVTGASAGLSAQRGKLLANGTRVHSLLEFTEEPTPIVATRCFKAGSLQIYNTTLANLLGDKRTFALLWEGIDSGIFTGADAESIRRYIPWTRRMVSGVVSYRGRSGPLADIVIANRETLVLKPASGAGGMGVTVGRRASADEWRHAVDTALRDTGAWIAQEVVTSRPYAFIDQATDTLKPHDGVWGIFCFGESYGGSFLRTLPKDEGTGVINAHRGAAEAVIFETDGGAYEASE